MITLIEKKNGGNGNIMNKRVLSTIRVQEYYLFFF